VNRRDRTVVTLLVLALVVIGGVLAIPRQAAAPPPESSPDPTPLPAATYSEGVVGTADSITPVTARTRAERALVGLVFSGLVKLGAGTTYQPDLAESWTTDESGKVWTFRIRDDAVWQDGEPVTSADVVYTIEALKSPDAAGAGAAAWADVTVEAIDEKTVALSLGTPIGSMLAAATQPLLPAHLLQEVPFADLADSEFARAPVGTGPFRLESLDDAHAVLVPAWTPEEPVQAPSDSPQPSADSLLTPYPRASIGGPGPYFGAVEMRFYPDEVSLSEAFEAGIVDAASGLSAGPAEALSSLDGVKRHVYPTTTLSAVLLNLRPSHKELRDPKVRTALLGQLDRDSLVSGVLGGDATRADALVPPESWSFDAASAGTVAFDRDAAAKALKAAGWTRKSGGSWIAPSAAKPYRLSILTVPEASNPRLAAIAKSVRDDWRAAGFEVDLKMVKAADLATALRTGDYTAAVVDIAQGLEPDLYPLLATTQVRASGTNLAGYQDPSLDPLLEAARKPATMEERLTAWKALEAGLATRMPILPLVWNDDVTLARGLEGDSPRLISAPGDRFWDVLAWRLAADR
jgi:peptide/nickel transport system substrate-binding protein